MDVQKVLFMNGGEGDTSYAKNSSLQKGIIEATTSVVEEAVLDLCCATFPDKLSVVDLGCASGPNTLSVVSDVVDVVEERCRQLGRAPPEFQLFLNDLPGNDFNALFRSLESFYEKREESSGGGGKLRRCFVAGVPGSFYGRLFPIKSIHFFHSSTSLQWLSQVPLKLHQPEVLLNKGNINISKESPPSVCDAYSKQFEKDFSNFLKFRSKEMVVEGRMVLILVGRKTLDPTIEEATIYHWNLLTQVLRDMVKEGSIPEKKLDLFNLPFYAPCVMEVEHLVQKEGSFFLKSLEIFDVVWNTSQHQDNHIEQEVTFLDELTRGQAMANIVRAGIESMLASHFGDQIIEDIFFRYGKVLEVYFSENEAKLANLVVSLVRKS